MQYPSSNILTVSPATASSNAIPINFSYSICDPKTDGFAAMTLLFEMTVTQTEPFEISSAAVY